VRKPLGNRSQVQTEGKPCRCVVVDVLGRLLIGM
jgi:hypothetical protein